MTETKTQLVMHTSEESRNLNLETRVKEPQERIFTTDIAAKIISEAQLLRSFNERKNEGAITQSVTERYGSTLSAKTLYQMAKDFGIETSYIDRIIESRYPSEEQKTSDIIKFDSYPSHIAQIYPIYIREIRRAVATQMPFDRLSVEIVEEHYGYYGKIDINRIKGEREIVKRRLLMPWKKKKEKITDTELVAEVSVNLGTYPHLNVKVKSYDPTFLNKCGEFIKDIGRFFPTLDMHISFSHTYNIDSK